MCNETEDHRGTEDENIFASQPFGKPHVKRISVSYKRLFCIVLPASGLKACNVLFPEFLRVSRVIPKLVKCLCEQLSSYCLLNELKIWVRALFDYFVSDNDKCRCRPNPRYEKAMKLPEK